MSNDLNNFVMKKGKEKTPFDKKNEEKKVTKLVRISEDIQIKAKIYSVQNKIRMTELLDLAVKEYLERH